LHGGSSQRAEGEGAMSTPQPHRRTGSLPRQRGPTFAPISLPVAVTTYHPTDYLSPAAAIRRASMLGKLRSTMPRGGHPIAASSDTEGSVGSDDDLHLTGFDVQRQQSRWDPSLHASGDDVEDPFSSQPDHHNRDRIPARQEQFLAYQLRACMPSYQLPLGRAIVHEPAAQIGGRRHAHFI
jgi:hypothetical protein